MNQPILKIKTRYYTATSINGYIADENNSLNWLFQFGEIESMKDHYPRFIREIGASAMGATTYEWILKHEYLLENPEKWTYDIPHGFSHTVISRLWRVPISGLRKAVKWREFCMIPGSAKFGFRFWLR